TNSPAQQVAWLHVPRFTWRVESTRSHYRIQECANWSVQHHQFTREVLGACISAHMIGEKYYNSPCAILSLTGSLLWALNYAHWLLSQGRLDIQIFLVDAWEIPKESISPAGFLAAHLEVAPLDIPWHDDPYHEYFVFGHVPSHAILGSVGIESAAGKEINTLLPGFGQLHPRERLHESLGRLQRWTNVWGKLAAVASVTDDEIWAAGLTARKFLRNPHPDVHFEITMMFLALRKRDWSTEVWWRLLSVFKCT
ncbi:hypothetical protein C8A00DRAFT_19475, partial [Chaetomidium leptoderma]